MHTIYDPIKKCIYCGATSNLGKEHIVPLSLNGASVLPRASCSTCGEITSKIERTAAETLYKSLRIVHEAKTRRPKSRPTELSFKTKNGIATAPVRQCFGTYPTFKFEQPGFFKDFKTPSSLWGDIVLGINVLTPKDNGIFDKHENVTIGNQEFDVNAYAFLMVKIAHCLAVGSIGVDNFDAWLPEIILENKNLLLPYVVGSFEKEIAPPVQIQHETNFSIYPWDGGDGIDHFISVRIRLFAYVGGPSCDVIVGTTDNERLERIKTHIKRQEFLNNRS